MVCLVIELSDRQELGGRYRPAHVGDLIRRMSAISQRDSLQCCSDVFSHPDWYRPTRPITPCPSPWKGTPTAMSIVADTHPFVVGVDTHARNPVYTIDRKSTRLNSSH